MSREDLHAHFPSPTNTLLCSFFKNIAMFFFSPVGAGVLDTPTCAGWGNSTLSLISAEIMT